MALILTIINQKGGVGKSTTANALGSGLMKRGNSVLFFDLDAQCNLTSSLKLTPQTITSLEVLTGKVSVEDATAITREGAIVPGSPNLVSADSIIKDTGKEFRLKEALEPISNQYDYVIIDTPPTLSVLTVNALTCCDYAIIPSEADYFSLGGVTNLYDTISLVQKYCNPNLKIGGILLTRYNTRTIFSKDLTNVLSNVAEKMGTKVFETKIRECVAIKEALSMSTNIFDYAPRSKGALDYNSFIDEFLKEVENNG